MNMMTKKSICGGRVLKLLRHKLSERGMELIEEASRCIQRGEIHELVTTDNRCLVPGDRVDRVGFLGFVEFDEAGVVEAGDRLIVAGFEVGVVVGFDCCHHPNHYNIIVEAATLLSGDDIDISVGHRVLFMPPEGPIDTSAPATVVIGYGHAGRDLHIPCLLKAFDHLSQSRHHYTRGPVYVVDPCPEARSRAKMEASAIQQVLPDISAVPAVLRERAVVHVCTPPGVRFELLSYAAGLGYRNFVVEKPMVQGSHDLEALERLLGEEEIDILVVSNWMSSVLTAALEDRLRSGPRIRSMEIVHRKSRFRRSESNASHSTAIDVEMPHMVTLAQVLVGSSEIEHATCWDLRAASGKIISFMGGATVTLRSKEGQIAVKLMTDLGSPVRERSIRILREDGSRLEGYFPTSGDDHHSQMIAYDTAGRIVEHLLYEDDTMTRFFIDSHRYFAGLGVRPRSDFNFNREICTVLNEIKKRSVAQPLAMEEADTSVKGAYG